MKEDMSPIILEAKRLILQEQIDKLHNYALSNIEVRENISSRHFCSQEDNNSKEIKDNKKEKDINLLKTYFLKWKEFIRKQNEMKLILKEKNNKNEKLESFLRTLKKMKQEKVINNLKDKNKVEIENTQKKILILENTKADLTSKNSRKDLDNENIERRNVDLNFENFECYNFYTHKNLNPQSFKNRYEAQKNIIEQQKAKLKEQEKLIEALRLGRIKEDLYKSIKATKNTIHEVFQNASPKVKMKMMPALTVQCADVIDLQLNSSKAPKIVQEMEKRAEERALKREIILEKKRMLDEERRKAAILALEQKRVQDEEERKKQLEAIKERRKRELEMEKKRQMNKQKWEEKFKIAEYYHNKKLKRIYFKKWKNMVIQMHADEETSKNAYEMKIYKKYFGFWMNYVRSIEEEKYAYLDQIYSKKLVLKMFDKWKEAVNESKQQMQVALDFYDMILQRKIINHWHRYTCLQYMIEHKNTQKAEKHYKSRILLQYFYQWKSLPAVLQLEKAKEEKRRKWREKVWEIIPDYQPTYNKF